MIRRIIANHVAAIGVVTRLIDCYPELHAVTECTEAHLCIFNKGINDLAIGKATLPCQHVGQIIMEQRDIRLKALGKAIVDNAIIEIDTALIDFPRSARQDA